MRRVLEFLIANRIFLLFLLLLFTSLYFVVQFQHYQNARFLHNANRLTASVHQTQSNVKDYFALRDINERLAAQNAQLLMNKRDTLLMDDLDSTSWMAKFNLTDFEVTYAKIVYNTVSKPINTFVINKGSSDGLIEGLGIASANGIVGKVLQVNRNYALCISILNTKTAVVMPKVLEMESKSGRLEWLGKNPVLMDLRDIHKFEEIDTGYHIVSSEYSISFPENIPVGKITSISKSEESFYEIKVKLAADLRKERYVYVFKNKKKVELDSTININVN
jgi:rod shape-determining protein MreC